MYFVGWPTPDLVPEPSLACLVGYRGVGAGYVWPTIQAWAKPWKNTASGRYFVGQALASLGGVCITTPEEAGSTNRNIDFSFLDASVAEA